MNNKIIITVAETTTDPRKERSMCIRIGLNTFDRIEELSRKTNRTRSDIARIILTQALDLVEIKEDPINEILKGGD